MRKTVTAFSILTIFLLAGIAATNGNGEVNKTTLAGTIGIAARYPGDEGIENDSAVVFTEKFESTAISDLDQRWTNVGHGTDGSALFIVKDTTFPGVGKNCLKIKATKGRNVGGHLWKLLDEGYEKLYARFYCKFAPDAPYVHHFCELSGRDPNNTSPWPLGGAGTRPTGTDWFTVNIDMTRKAFWRPAEAPQAPPAGEWILYNYWSEMRSWQTPEGESDGRSRGFFGNVFGPLDEPLVVKRGVWQCVEVMIKLNDPEKRDGEVAFWIDGKLIERYGPGTIEGTWNTDKFWRTGDFNTNPQPFEGFRWRKVERIKINIFWLKYFLENIFKNDYNPNDPDIPYNDNVGIAYFDNVVLSKEYVGPIVTDQALPSGGDFDGDGQAGISDVIRLIKLCMEEYPDASADYNRDGAAGVTDALALLIDILKGQI